MEAWKCGFSHLYFIIFYIYKLLLNSASNSIFASVSSIELKKRRYVSWCASARKEPGFLTHIFPQFVYMNTSRPLLISAILIPIQCINDFFLYLILFSLFFGLLIILLHIFSHVCVIFIFIFLS